LVVVCLEKSKENLFSPLLCLDFLHKVQVRRIFFFVERDRKSFFSFFGRESERKKVFEVLSFSREKRGRKFDGNSSFQSN
jgi:hypothetical protein